MPFWITFYSIAKFGKVLITDLVISLGKNESYQLSGANTNLTISNLVRQRRLSEFTFFSITNLRDLWCFQRLTSVRFHGPVTIIANKWSRLQNRWWRDRKEDINDTVLFQVGSWLVMTGKFRLMVR